MRGVLETQYIFENCLDEANGKIFSVPDFENVEDIVLEDLIYWEPGTEDLIDNDFEMFDYLNEMDIEPVNENPI